MALLSEPDWSEVTFFAGAERILAAHTGALPQPDQLCGPFAARLALQGVLDELPSMVGLARSVGTRIWPYDVPAWRPDGAPWDTTGWADLPRADDLEESGTDADGLVRGLRELCGSAVAVEHVTGPDWSDLAGLLRRVGGSAYPVGVIANVHTGPINPPDAEWDVGHFVILLGLAGDTHVAVADTYAALGAPGAPPGCRLVSIAALAEALAAPPGRSLILVAGRSHETDLAARVAG